MIKIIHSADWHLRDMQFGKAARAQDFTDSVFRIVDIAVEQGADYILCAGDILNSKKPSSRNINDLLNLNKKLLSVGVKLLVITGNHDKCNPSWIRVIQDISAEDETTCAIYDIDWELYTMKGRDGKPYTVYGVPDMPPDEFREKNRSFPAADFMMIHALIKDFAAFDAGDKVLKVSDLPADKYKAILLGDIHVYRYINQGDCVIGYPGSTELCSKNESPEKFVSLVTIPDIGAVQVDQIPLKLNKPIIIGDVTTPEEANELLERVIKVKSENPTVLVRKSPEFVDLYARISRIVDTSKSIIRVNNLPKKGFKLMNLNNRVLVADDKEPKDFVADYFPKDTDTFDLAQALCDPDNKPAFMIESFIDQRLYANKKLKNKKFGEA
jgi:DNA repair exonuclease SbcCD nuclease subunit